ncbi:MAG: ribonuclease G [Balneolaceae bacterium]|nr:MAG: ribonuclease G [Balneolaceae bacterium]
MEENSSVQGEKAAMPEELNRWNWGAFSLNAFWGVGNKTYVALFALVPVINIFMMIALGLKGNKWAWENKEWKSVEHFTKVQKRWNIAGYFALGLYLYFFIAGLVRLL